jgi:hypothetical protein
VACHRVTLGSSVVIWLMIPCGLPQGSSLQKYNFLLLKFKHRFTLIYTDLFKFNIVDCYHLPVLICVNLCL